MNTFVDILRSRVDDSTPHDITFFDGSSERALSYGELDAAAQTLAAQLRATGARRGDRVLLLVPPGLDFIRAFFGCLYAGLVAVPLPVPSRSFERSSGQIASIATDCAARLFLTTSGLLAAVQAFVAARPALANAHVEALADAWPRTRPAKVAFEGDGHALAFLQYTSGSTGSPKGVMVTHANLIANSELIRQSFAHTRADRGVIWLPPYHDMGLIGGILQPIFVGFPVYLMDPKCFVTRPFRWLLAVSNQRATVSGGPNFAFELALQISPDESSQLDLSTWRVAFTGAEPISASVLQRFQRRFEPSGFRQGALRPVYGLAEATLLVSCGEPGTGLTIGTYDRQALQRGRAVPIADGSGGGRRLVACGQPRCTVMIVNPDTAAPCPEGEVGEIWVRSPSTAAGYFGKPEETGAVFGARSRTERDDTDAFLRTGDLGFLDRGELTICGRLKDLIIIRGRNLSPEDIEASVVTAPLGVLAAAAVSIQHDDREGLAVIAEVARPSAHDARELAVQIARSVGREHQVAVERVLVVKARTLPRTSSGKLRRGEARSALIAGMLQPLAEATSQALAAPEPQTLVERELVALWSDALGRSLGVHDNFFDLGGDSVTAVRLQAGAAERAIVFELHDLFDNPTVASLAARVQTRSLQRQSAGASAPVTVPPDQLAIALRELGAARGEP